MNRTSYLQELAEQLQAIEASWDLMRDQDFVPEPESIKLAVPTPQRLREQACLAGMESDDEPTSVPAAAPAVDPAPAPAAAAEPASDPPEGEDAQPVQSPAPEVPSEGGSTEEGVSEAPSVAAEGPKDDAAPSDSSLSPQAKKRRLAQDSPTTRKQPARAARRQAQTASNELKTPPGSSQKAVSSLVKKRARTP